MKILAKSNQESSLPLFMNEIEYFLKNFESVIKGMGCTTVHDKNTLKT